MVCKYLENIIVSTGFCEKNVLKLAMVAQICNPGTWEGQAGESIQDQPWLYSEFGARST